MMNIVPYTYLYTHTCSLAVLQARILTDWWVFKLLSIFRRLMIDCACVSSMWPKFVLAQTRLLDQCTYNVSSIKTWREPSRDRALYHDHRRTIYCPSSCGMAFLFSLALVPNRRSCNPWTITNGKKRQCPCHFGILTMLILLPWATKII